MISAFGVDHGGISKRAPTRKERADHYGRMSGAMGALGGVAGTVGAGAGAIGLAEHKGKDPMDFTHRSLGEYDKKPMSQAARGRILKPMAAAHGGQAAVLGGVAAGAGGLSYAYHRKKKKELARKSLVAKKRDNGSASQAGLAAGSAATGYGALKYGGKFGNWMHHGAKTLDKEAREAHHLIGGAKLGDWEIPKQQISHAKNIRRTAGRAAGVKYAGAAGSVGAAAAGGAGLYELGRYHLKRRK